MSLHTWCRRLWYLVNRRRFERELEREMTAHRREIADARRFGNTLRLREEAADAWGWRWLDDLARDLRYGVRQLAHAPGFAATAILTLTVGIGATTAIFSVVNSVLLRSLPVPAADRLAVLGDAARPAPSWSEPVWQQIRQRADLFDGALAWSPVQLDLSRGGAAQFVDGIWTSSEFFDVLGVRAALGRTFTRDDDRPGGGPDGPVVVISDSFWRRHFAAAPDVIGRSLFLNAVAFTVVGVTPEEFFGTDVGRRFDVAVPIGTDPLLMGNNSSLGLATRNWLSIMVRLQPGQTADAAAAALRRVQPQIRDAVLPLLPAPLQPAVLTEPFILVSAARGVSPVREQYARPLLVMLAVVGLVLLIACVNIANLLLARAVARRGELILRMAIGASRPRLARMLLAEALALASVGAVLGFALSRVLGQLLVAQLSSGNATLFVDLAPDWRVLLFAVALTAITAVLFGVAPAWHWSRVGVHDQGRGAAAAGPARIAVALVGAQLALSLVLVVGAGLFVRTFSQLASQNFGFEKDRVLVVDVTAPMTRYTLPQLVGVYARLRDVVASLPGVERAALSDITPIGGSSRTAFVEVPGAAQRPRGDRLIMVNVVSPGWFGTYGTRLLAGRDFSEHDRRPASPVAIVNAAFARQFLNGASAVGLTVHVNNSPLEIVGMAEDAVYRTVRDPAPPTLYTPTMQREAARPYVRISVRAAAERPAVLAPAIEAAIRQVDPALTLQFDVVAEQVDAAMVQERVLALLSAAFGLIALALASIGLYGITSYAVSLRRAEIGVRLALGAARATVIRLVIRGIVTPVAAGIVAGAGLSLWLTQFVAALVWGLEARDPATFIAAAILLGGVGALAGWLPAWHASRMNPVQVLRGC